jgi:hypothetical protein
MPMFGAWLQLMRTVTEANLSAPYVIAMRMNRLAQGGALATREAQRMVTEKIAVAAEANLLLLTGGLHSAAKRYRNAVRANERRLKKRKRFKKSR